MGRRREGEMERVRMKREKREREKERERERKGREREVSYFRNRKILYIHSIIIWLTIHSVICWYNLLWEILCRSQKTQILNYMGSQLGTYILVVPYGNIAVTLAKFSQYIELVTLKSLQQRGYTCIYVLSSFGEPDAVCYSLIRASHKLPEKC